MIKKIKINRYSYRIFSFIATVVFCLIAVLLPLYYGIGWDSYDNITGGVVQDSGSILHHIKDIITTIVRNLSDPDSLHPGPPTLAEPVVWVVLTLFSIVEVIMSIAFLCYRRQKSIVRITIAIESLTVISFLLAEVLLIMMCSDSEYSETKMLEPDKAYPDAGMAAINFIFVTISGGLAITSYAFTIKKYFNKKQENN